MLKPILFHFRCVTSPTKPKFARSARSFTSNHLRLPLPSHLIINVLLSLLQLRLNASQLEEKRSHEAAVKEIQDQVEAEEDATKKEVLRVELAAREAKLNSLMDRFAKTTLEAAMSGEAPRVSQMRKQQLEAAAAAGAAAAAPVAPYGAAPGGGGSNYNPRYNPTQQYAGPNQRGGYQQQPQRGGFEHYNAGGRNYFPRGGRSAGGGRGGSGGRGGVPEWAQEEYPSRGGSGHRGGFDTSGGYRPAPGGGYGDTSDAGFFDQPSGGGAPRGRGGGGGGRGGGGGGRGRGGNYYDVFNPTGYSGGGRGVGGEINFDTFAGQDRY